MNDCCSINPAYYCFDKQEWNLLNRLPFNLKEIKLVGNGYAQITLSGYRMIGLPFTRCNGDNNTLKFSLPNGLPKQIGHQYIFITQQGWSVSNSTNIYDCELSLL